MPMNANCMNGLISCDFLKRHHGPLQMPNLQEQLQLRCGALEAQLLELPKAQVRLRSVRWVGVTVLGAVCLFDVFFWLVHVGE